MPKLLSNRYRLIKHLGEGGFGDVFLAEDTFLDGRSVAIKISPRAIGCNPEAVEQVKREALIAMKLSHPHIVTLRGFEQDETIAYLVMDYVDGTSLKRAWESKAMRTTAMPVASDTTGCRSSGLRTRVSCSPSRHQTG